jgi:hypothetical protein
MGSKSEDFSSNRGIGWSFLSGASSWREVEKNWMQWRWSATAEGTGYSCFGLL